MRFKALIALVAAASWLAGSATAGVRPARPMRVMSMNLCADQLTMLLLDPGRISSISYVSQEGAAAPELDALAHRLRINHGLAEEVLAQKPDLIVAGEFTTPLTRQLARRMGIPMVELPAAASFEDIRSQLRTLGAALGEGERAEYWIARMDRTLGDLARTAPPRKIRAVAWNGIGRVPGKQSLLTAILEAAGGVNIAAGEGAYERSLDLEQLLTARPQPDVLLYGIPARISVGAAADLVRHPVLARAYGGRRLAYPQSAESCGTPFAADAAVALRGAMLAAVARAKGAR